MATKNQTFGPPLRTSDRFSLVRGRSSLRGGSINVIPSVPARNETWGSRNGAKTMHRSPTPSDNRESRTRRPTPVPVSRRTSNSRPQEADLRSSQMRKQGRKRDVPRGAAVTRPRPSVRVACPSLRQVRTSRLGLCPNPVGTESQPTTYGSAIAGRITDVRLTRRRCVSMDTLKRELHPIRSQATKD
jgi:hypothetical protein